MDNDQRTVTVEGTITSRQGNCEEKLFTLLDVSMLASLFLLKKNTTF